MDFKVSSVNHFFDCFVKYLTVSIAASLMQVLTISFLYSRMSLRCLQVNFQVVEIDLVMLWQIFVSCPRFSVSVSWSSENFVCFPTFQFGFEFSNAQVMVTANICSSICSYILDEWSIFIVDAYVVNLTFSSIIWGVECHLVYIFVLKCGHNIVWLWM